MPFDSFSFIRSNQGPDLSESSAKMRPWMNPCFMAMVLTPSAGKPCTSVYAESIEVVNPAGMLISMIAGCLKFIRQ